MKALRCDVAVLGSGFGGCLMARILASLGYQVVVLERAKHPRFTIGESSTPIADQTLRRLCERFGLCDLEPLTRYGSARSLKSAVVGAKRGFTYIDSACFNPNSQTVDQHEMLVSASSGLEEADTHWHRASVDQFFARSLTKASIPLYEQTQVQRCEWEESRQVWILRALQNSHQSETSRESGERLTVEARGIVDASGRGSPLAASLGLAPTAQGLLTYSGALFGHVVGWRPLESLVGTSHHFRDRHPYPLDQAALHHVASDGWLWQLAFDSEVTSVGWCVAPHALPGADADRDWWWKQRLAISPWLQSQGESAERVSPVEDWGMIERMQFTRQQMAGKKWWMLPGAAGFIDPLHSSGIAHTMVAIERLAAGFLQAGPGELPTIDFSRHYDLALRTETQWIDRLVALCYDWTDDFERFCLASMLYFAAAVHFERLSDAQSQSQDERRWPLFLAADDHRLRQALEVAFALMERPVQESWSSRAARCEGARRSPAVDRFAHEERERGNPETRAFWERLRQALEPINHAGLLANETHPYYAHTAAPK